MSTCLTSRRRALAALACLAAGPLPARADWPNATGSIVLPFSAGTSVDRLARAVAEHYSEVRPARFVTVNMPGAGGSIATQHVLKGPHDGRLLLMAGSGLLQLPVLSKAPLGFDPLVDLHPVGMLSELDFFVFTRAGNEAGSLRALRPRRVDGRPESLFFAANTIGGTGHVGGLLLGRQLGLPVTFVPYRDSNQALIDTAEGRVDFGVFGWEAAAPFLQAGTLKALSVLSDRAPGYAPGVPTLKDQGIRGIDVRPWNALFAASATPAPLLARLEAELRAIWDSKPLARTIASLRFEPTYRDSAALRRFMVAEVEEFRGIARDFGLAGAVQ